MISSFDREIRTQIAAALSGALGVAVETRSVRLPARQSDAGVSIPHGCDGARAQRADFGSLWGAPLVSSVHPFNGWLLFTFSDAFFDSLVARINASLPLPENDGGSRAVNRMLALGRHGGEGCPSVPALKRALLEALQAGRSPAAYRRAARAVETMFHTVPPRERPAILPRSGALGNALARLLGSVP
ncbi:MAG: hypothetical protein LLF75_12790 [Eubacteriales bacterium]|nr:hypothetical protein [Eubacteriales bacterium]